MPAVTSARSSISRPASSESFGILTCRGVPSSHTVATHIGRVAGVWDGCRLTYRISPSTGATMPNTGLISTLPARLIWFVRFCRVGFTVVSTVPRGSRPGVSSASWDDVQPASRAATDTAAPHRASLRLSTDSPLAGRPDCSGAQRRTLIPARPERTLQRSCKSGSRLRLGLRGPVGASVKPRSRAVTVRGPDLDRVPLTLERSSCASERSEAVLSPPGVRQSRSLCPVETPGVPVVLTRLTRLPRSPACGVCPSAAFTCVRRLPVCRAHLRAGVCPSAGAHPRAASGPSAALTLARAASARLPRLAVSDSSAFACRCYTRPDGRRVAAVELGSRPRPQVGQHRHHPAVEVVGGWQVQFGQARCRRAWPPLPR